MSGQLNEQKSSRIPAPSKHAALNGKTSAGQEQAYEGGHSSSEDSPTSSQPRAMSSEAGEDGAPSHVMKHTSSGRPAKKGSGAADGNDAQHAIDVRSAFAGVPRLRPQWVHKYMTILVVGESGLGKTTFIQNMFAAYSQDATLPVNDASAPTAKDDFISSPEKLCTDITVKDEQNMIAFHYRVQDTPGYDNMEVNMDPILDYINDANHACLRREQDARRQGPLAKLPDPRVDVCVYFVAPHRLKPVDCKFIARLAKSVPVLPVLAKADSMTTKELDYFRKSVRETLSKVSKDEGRAVVHDFSNECLREAGVKAGVPPFAVISSNTNDLSVGRFWPVREYPWGSCEALSSAHSDLPALKKLLFEVAYVDLKDATEIRYYSFREQQLMHLDDPGLPLQRGTIVEQLHRAGLGRAPSRPVRRFLGTTFRFVVSGIVFYTAVALVSGGQRRVQSDLSRLQEAGGQAANEVKDQAVRAKDAVWNQESDEVKPKQEEASKPKRGPFGIFGRG